MMLDGKLSKMCHIYILVFFNRGCTGLPILMTCDGDYDQQSVAALV